jgi:hypothetical protein
MAKLFIKTTEFSLDERAVYTRKKLFILFIAGIHQYGEFSFAASRISKLGER